ncbi:LuxR C-terminal-related transcriptional regulator [Pseudescherichia sp.]|uniref:helix-turn-helix transcriptional regulator n=1 Tax=Pseudescherichia sp. TaxID=2055881 RepID=UPI00289AA635|nr:LuxR C-terminal-related transcriptional regulator [Pseudescherichia sp.]
MLSEKYRCAVIISRAPIIQFGLGAIMAQSFCEYEIIYCTTPEEMTLSLLQHANVIIVDLTNDLRQARSACKKYHSIMVQLLDIHWVFIVPLPIYPLAVELLLRSESTLLSSMEPVDGIINAVRSGNRRAEIISRSLLSENPYDEEEASAPALSLTYSERQVLRLLGKGWGINQIASMLKKSNKTVSAQKNSAMRRLTLRSNAELYAWINSGDGAKILNLNPTYGEDGKWKKVDQEDMLPLLNDAP